MHVLIVYAHPEPISFNAALKNVAVETILSSGHSAEVSDLYAEKFNPAAGRHDFSTVADPGRFHYQSEQLLAATHNGFSEELRREQDRLQRADLLILQFPLWWGAPPAILKGWFDRVLAYGFAYADGRRYAKGLFKGRGALMCVTTGGTTARFSAEGEYEEIERVLWPVRRLTLEYMGLDVAEPFVCYATPRVDAATRDLYLRDWRQCVRDSLARRYDRRDRDDALVAAEVAASNPTNWASGS
jgi:NAD(P)H dehydrogenase (quinone)